MQRTAPLPFTFITFTGENRKTLLQGQLTCDLDTLSPTNPIMGCYANLKGRLQGTFVLFEDEACVVMAVPYDSEVAQHCEAALSKFAPFSQVSVAQSKDYIVIGTQGHVTGIETSGVLAYQQDRHLVFLTKAQYDAIADSSQTVSLEDWQLGDFESRIPHITAVTLEQFLPHYINLVELGAINFKKGCYLGQEVIARMHYRGNLKKSLQYFAIPLDTTLSPGQSITLDEQPIEIVNCLHTKQQTHLLAIVA